ncbi:MAG: hypothetical protein JNJ71_19545 [Rubrivivax sp.]|nr:hypothetical protein [Rubrivivax sp.]
MNLRTLTLTVLAAASLTIIGCTDPRVAEREAQRAQLSSQLVEADAGYLLAVQAVAGHQQRLEGLQQSAADIDGRRRELDRNVEAFMLNHKMAVAALVAGVAGGQVAFDSNGSYSAEARDVAAVVGLLAVGWALFNMDEVMHVASELAKADSFSTQLRREQESLAQALAAERQLLAQAQAQLAQSGQRVQGIRTSLASLH